MRGVWTAGALSALLLAAAACSPRNMAIDRMAALIASSGSVYEADNDPEFVRLAAPSTLKTIEILLAQSPQHPGLLLSACSGFTEYSYAFLHVESELKAADVAAANELRRRAGAMYGRARDYCLRGLRVRHASFTRDALIKAPVETLRIATREDVPQLYWTAAAWGSELLLAQDRIRRIGDLVVVRALIERARALDDTWQNGAIYEALIALDGLPVLLGGSREAVRTDFQRAIELSHGHSVLAYVAMAAVVNDPAERRRLLQQAIAIDPNQIDSRRLTNLIAQRYARALLQQR
jgi:hypothetical protein